MTSATAIVALLDPLPPRPWEPQGPSPRRRLSDRGKLLVASAIIAIVFLALTLFMCVPGPFGVSPG